MHSKQCAALQHSVGGVVCAGAPSVAEGLPQPEGPGPLDPGPAAAPGPAEALDRQGLPHLLLAGRLHLPHCLPHRCAAGHSALLLYLHPALPCAPSAVLLLVLGCSSLEPLCGFCIKEPGRCTPKTCPTCCKHTAGQPDISRRRPPCQTAMGIITCISSSADDLLKA